MITSNEKKELENLEKQKEELKEQLKPIMARIRQIKNNSVLREWRKKKKVQ